MSPATAPFFPKKSTARPSSNIWKRSPPTGKNWSGREGRWRIMVEPPTSCRIECRPRALTRVSRIQVNEERDALFDHRSDQGNHLLPVTRRALTETHAHAAQPDGRDF